MIATYLWQSHNILFNQGKKPFAEGWTCEWEVVRSRFSSAQWLCKRGRGVPPAASAGALPCGGRSLTGLQGPCHPRLLGCGGLPGTEETKHQRARPAAGPALHGAAGGVAIRSSCSRAHCRQRSTKCGWACTKSPHIHVFREKLAFGKGKQRRTEVWLSAHSIAELHLHTSLLHGLLHLDAFPGQNLLKNKKAVHTNPGEHKA